MKQLRTLCCSVLIGVVWSGYIRALGGGSPALAALMDAILIGLSGVVVLDYTSDRRLLPWAMLGGALGTYGASRLAA